MQLDLGPISGIRLSKYEIPRTVEKEFYKWALKHDFVIVEFCHFPKSASWSAFVGEGLTCFQIACSLVAREFCCRTRKAGKTWTCRVVGEAEEGPVGLSILENRFDKPIIRPKRLNCRIGWGFNFTV